MKADRVQIMIGGGEDIVKTKKKENYDIKSLGIDIFVFNNYICIHVLIVILHF